MEVKGRTLPRIYVRDYSLNIKEKNKKLNLNTLGESEIQETELQCGEFATSKDRVQ